jgi:hypothetical protein
VGQPLVLWLRPFPYDAALGSRTSVHPVVALAIRQHLPTRWSQVVLKHPAEAAMSTLCYLTITVINLSIPFLDIASLNAGTSCE